MLFQYLKPLYTNLFHKVYETQIDLMDLSFNYDFFKKFFQLTVTMILNFQHPLKLTHILKTATLLKNLTHIFIFKSLLIF